MIVIYLAFRYIFGIIIAEKKTRMYDIQCCVLIILENVVSSRKCKYLLIYHYYRLHLTAKTNHKNR